MKKTSSIFLSALMLWAISFQTGCLGSFKLTTDVWKWNTGISKWPAELVFIVFNIIPVYGIAVFIDAILLNSIEFWTGSGPLSLKQGEKESQLVMGADGNNYEIIATQNRFDIYQLDGKNAGDVKSIVYNTEEKSWSYENSNMVVKLVQLSENGATVQLFAPNGQVAVVPTNITDKSVISAIVEEQIDVNLALIK
jgi:hypothetical protein